MTRNEGGKGFEQYSPKTRLILMIITSVVAGLILWFIFGTDAHKFAAVFVCPILIIYSIYQYFHETKDDKNADKKFGSVDNGTYFDSPEWKNAYAEYKMSHPFEKPQGPTMREDLLRRYKRKEDFIWMAAFLVLMFGCVVTMYDGFKWYAPVGILIFGFLLKGTIDDYTGRPVRVALKRDIDYPKLERSYMSSRMLTYKKNGLAFGTTHIHIFTASNVYFIDYYIAEDISRKIVRVKNYDDGMYSGNDYKHYAVIHVYIPDTGSRSTVEVELDEFQVEMVIDEFTRIKNMSEVKR